MKKESNKPPFSEEMVMRKKDVEVMGMLVDEWQYLSCSAQFGVGDDWATLYMIESKEEGKGHATGLLTTAKHVYESEGKEVKGSVALNERMRTLYQELGIPEITEDDDEENPQENQGDGRAPVRGRDDMVSPRNH